MGIFNRKKADAEEARDLSSVPWYAPFDQGGAAHRGTMSADAVVSLAPVFACTRIISTNIASLPIKAYRRDAQGQLTPNTFIPNLLFAPAARDNTFQWVQKCLVSLCLRGNAYGLVTSTDTFGMPKTVEWIHPDEMTVDETSVVKPVFTWNGVVQKEGAIVHIPWIVQPGKVVGLSPIAAFASTFGVGLSATAYGKQWFDNGGAPPSVLKNTEKQISPDDAREARKRASAAIRSGEPMVFGKDWDFTAIQINPEEAQFLQTIRANAATIASIYGVPPEMVGGDTGSSMTYSSTEQNAISLASLTLRPWIANLETAFSNLLVTRDEVRFDVDAMIRMSTKDRYEAHNLALDGGWLNVDEVRAKEHLPPLPNGEGQTYNVSTKLAPVVPDATTPTPTAPVDTTPPDAGVTA